MKDTEEQDFEVSLRVLGNEVIAFKYNGGLANKTFNRGMLMLVVTLGSIILFGQDFKDLLT